MDYDSGVGFTQPSQVQQPATSNRMIAIVVIGLVVVIVGIGLFIYYNSSKSSSSPAPAPSPAQFPDLPSSTKPRKPVIPPVEPAYNVPSSPSPAPSPSPASIVGCDIASITCPNSSYAVCHPDGHPVCVECEDFKQVSSTCYSDSTPKCANGKTACKPCGTCPTGEYPKCSEDGKLERCIPCEGFDSFNCPIPFLPTKECINGKNVCI